MHRRQRYGARRVLRAREPRRTLDAPRRPGGGKGAVFQDDDRSGGVRDGASPERESTINAKDLQFIRISEGRAVLKRGTQELLLSGPAVTTVVEPVLELLDGSRSRQEIVEAFPADLRPEVESLLRGLTGRRLITGEAEPQEARSGIESLGRAFFWNFGERGEAGPEKLHAARVLVVGANLITRSLVRSLLEIGVGGVTVAAHPVLDNHLIPFAEAPPAGADAGERLKRLDAPPPEDALGEFSLLCATCDFGEAEALLEVNRLGLRQEKPFLPVWLADLRGHVGPLNHPFETACLRCYRVRADSHDAHHDVSRAVRLHVNADPAARAGAGLLPPMAGILGEIAAMEIAKFLADFMPSDAVGRQIEINLVSFSSAVRRVLKIPRCPECSDAMRRAPAALTVGPAIPVPE